MISKNKSRETRAGPTAILDITMSHHIDESISALGSLIPIRKDPNVNRLASSFGVWFVYAFYFQKHPYCSLDSSKSVLHSL